MYDVPDLSETQQALNRTSAGRWELFRSHREQLMSLIRAQLPAAGGRVCILGAGNCNDVDLGVLTAVGAEVDLVDIDGDALRLGVARQGSPTSVHIHADVDITGVWSALAAVRGRASSEAVQAIARLAAKPAPLPLTGCYDVVVSPALLTQLIDSAAECVGPEHAQLDGLATSLRAGHIRTILGLTRPKARALLVTEIISSRELPALADADERDLPGLAFRALMLQQTYKSTNPVGIVSWLAAHRPHNARLAHPGVTGPWRWWLTPRICYLVVGLVFTRS